MDWTTGHLPPPPSKKKNEQIVEIYEAGPKLITDDSGLHFFFWRGGGVDSTNVRLVTRRQDKCYQTRLD